MTTLRMLTRAQARTLDLIADGGWLAYRFVYVPGKRQPRLYPHAIAADGDIMGRVNGRTFEHLIIWGYVALPPHRLEVFAMTELGREALDRYRMRAS